VRVLDARLLGGLGACVSTSNPGSGDGVRGTIISWRRASGVVACKQIYQWQVESCEPSMKLHYCRPVLILDIL
jgi:hypothetical protein